MLVATKMGTKYFGDNISQSRAFPKSMLFAHVNITLRVSGERRRREAPT
jgi:hypothetical protein